MFQSQSAEMLAYSRQTDSSNTVKFDDLCLWIESHIEESIGWEQLMRHSGLEYQVIQDLFFRNKSTTPMVWIRRLREARGALPKTGRPKLSLVKRKPELAADRIQLSCR